MDPYVFHNFAFRVLRENRRIVNDEERREELNQYHSDLDSVGHGLQLAGVEQLVVEAFARAALAKQETAELAEFEGVTTIFAKRRYRDRWNRAVLNRLARLSGHTLRIKGEVVHQHGKGNERFKESTKKCIRQHAKTQSLWNLKLAGNWHPSYDEHLQPQRPYMMRVMLLANIDVDQHFANGTQGRLLCWSPGEVEGRGALPATRSDITARFAKETSLQKRDMLIEVDYIDVKPRRETILSSRGHPALLQEPIVPAYALTVHKCQSLTIRHATQGCIEGIFASGQFYTMVTRATDPRLFQLIGLPPVDLLDKVVVPQTIRRRFFCCLCFGFINML